MNKTLGYLTYAAISCTLLFNCTDDSKDPAPASDEEFKFLRVMVSDEATTDLTLIDPSKKEIVSFNAKFPKSSLYTSESGRYGALIHRENNFVETFDVGLEFHGDHVDMKGTPKFGAMIGESKQPTHFKSKRGEIMTFNDGDGSLSVGQESDIHSNGIRMKSINADLKPHHGAMASFSNGYYAVTEKTGDVSGTLPEKVKVIDALGKTIYPSDINTKGIHGNATDGLNAVFGSADGVLVVNQNGQQKLIPYPNDFGTAWFGTILETSTQGNFIGYTAAKGAWLINVEGGTLTALTTNTDIMQVKLSLNEKIFAYLTHGGELVLIDILAKSETLRTKVLPQTSKEETQKPQMVLSERFVYITQPKTGELLQISFKNISDVIRHKVSSTPYRLTLLGYESDESH